MTLDDLTCYLTVQGNVRISRWEDDEEKDIMTFEDMEDMMGADLGVHAGKTIAYMFAAPDGYLHIETRDY